MNNCINLEDKICREREKEGELYIDIYIISNSFFFPKATVSSCTWRSSSASHVCETKQPGYRWQHANSKVRLVITGVRKAQEGEYSCQLVDHMPDSTTPCRLEVNGMLIS